MSEFLLNERRVVVCLSVHVDGYFQLVNVVSVDQFATASLLVAERQVVPIPSHTTANECMLGSWEPGCCTTAAANAGCYWRLGCYGLMSHPSTLIPLILKTFTLLNALQTGPFQLQLTPWPFC